MLLFILYKLGEFLSCYLPSQLAYWIAEIIADLCFFFPLGKHKIYKEAVLHNLKIIEYNNTLYGRRVFRHFAYYLREFLWLAKISKKKFFRETIPVGVENLEAALSFGKGVLLLSAHFGNWEWGGIALACCGYRMCFFVRPHKNVYTDRLFNSLREKKGVRVIPISNLKQVIGSLRQNKVVGILCDEGNKGIEVNICGKKLTLASGPFKMAYKLQAVVAPAFMIRDKKTRKQKGIVEPPILLDRSLSMEESVKKAANEFARIMEDYLRFYPGHWLLLERKFFS